VLPLSSQQIVFQELVDTINERERRRDRLERQLDELAPRWSGYALAQALLAFRGIQKTVAYTVVAEVHDLSRFAHPRYFMAWLGLVPGEHSSGATRRQGPITRCGNRFARTLLTEAASLKLELRISIHGFETSPGAHRSACITNTKSSPPAANTRTWP
jgi:transposase